jgi:SHS2 domain-containing protein
LDEVRFKILEHPSDLGIEAYGSSKQEVFRNAALGLMSVVAGESRIEPSQERAVTLQALDCENLMVRWLTEILYLYDAEKFLTAKMKFETLSDTSLKAILLGERYDELRHELKLDVKAITYHQLNVACHDDDWIARVFVDV